MGDIDVADRNFTFPRCHKTQEALRPKAEGMSTRVAVTIAVALTAAVVLAGAALAVALTRGGSDPPHKACRTGGSVYAVCGGGSSYFVP